VREAAAVDADQMCEPRLSGPSLAILACMRVQSHSQSCARMPQAFLCSFGAMRLACLPARYFSAVVVDAAAASVSVQTRVRSLAL